MVRRWSGATYGIARTPWNRDRPLTSREKRIIERMEKSGKEIKKQHEELLARDRLERERERAKKDAGESK